MPLADSAPLFNSEDDGRSPKFASRRILRQDSLIATGRPSSAENPGPSWMSAAVLATTRWLHSRLFGARSGSLFDGPGAKYEPKKLKHHHNVSTHCHNL